jgi:drug/metabolite transporter (DMT)-like permease
VGEVPSWPTVIGGVLVLSGVFGRLLYESAKREDMTSQDVKGSM